MDINKMKQKHLIHQTFAKIKQQQAPSVLDPSEVDHNHTKDRDLTNWLAVHALH